MPNSAHPYTCTTPAHPYTCTTPAHPYTGTTPAHPYTGTTPAPLPAPQIHASAAVCNLLIEFSTAREPLLRAGVVQQLGPLAGSMLAELSLNAAWALKNLSAGSSSESLGPWGLGWLMLGPWVGDPGAWGG